MLRFFSSLVLACFLCLPLPALGQSDLGDLDQAGTELEDAVPQAAEPSPESRLAELFNLAENDEPEACVQLGTLYEQGNILPRNFGEALRWYRKAAGLDSAVGNYNTGICFEVGMGTVPDPVAALAYFERAAKLGLDQAMYKCAHYYLDGLTGVLDSAQAVTYLEQAAAAGHGTAANDLGLIYAQGLLEQTRDERRAMNMFILGADLGNPEAMKNIGVSFRQGIGRSPSDIKALKWFIIADTYGYPSTDMIVDLRQTMSAEDIAAAEVEADQWISGHEAGIPTQ